MYLSLNWIKQWVKLPKEITPEQLGHDFTMATVEVEEVTDQAIGLQGVVVGKITEITKHPQADRLEVCRVNIGDSEEQIVCGGTNLTRGMLVAVAKVGSKVKWHGEGELVTLEKVKIRGIESSGMIAAASEIGLANLFPQASAKEILDLSEFRLKPGQSLAKVLNLNDVIIDIDNKSINHRPDLWGQYGLARELAAIYKTRLKNYQYKSLDTSLDEIKLKVNVKDKDKCFRYLGLAIKNIKVEESPWWLKAKLQSVGMRPINNVVDVTNYVMYELGQPMHAFDARQIDGYQIEVKTAQTGEEFITLDGVKRKLSEQSLMIADKKKYVALAGIMGGQNSEIDNDTTEIILESACFQADIIRRTSTALGLRSESSARFEKSLDPVLAELAIHKAAEMILELSDQSYVASKLVDINNNPFTPISLTVKEELINQRFGSIIPSQEIKSILERLQFKVKYKAKTFYIEVPSWRATKDISIPEDIVEEVARVYGYDNIDSKLPQITLQAPQLNIANKATKEIKYWLSLAQEYNEVYTYAFTNQAWVQKLGLALADHIKVKNPVSPEQNLLNLSLLPNLLSCAENNIRYFGSFKIFELQRIFDKKDTSAYYTDNDKKKLLPLQDEHLAGIEVHLTTAEQAFFRTKGLIQTMQKHWGIDWVLEKKKDKHSPLSYVIKYQDVVLGQFGLLDKTLFDSNGLDVEITWWELNFSVLSKYINGHKKYKSLNKFPSINRDLAIVIDQYHDWQAIAKEVAKISPLIIRLEPFDVFMGKGVPAGKKSLAFHLEFMSPDKTLLAEDADELIKKIMVILDKKFKAILR